MTEFKWGDRVSIKSSSGSRHYGFVVDDRDYVRDEDFRFLSCLPHPVLVRLDGYQSPQWFAAETLERL